MTKEEILEYNKNVHTFLGYEHTSHDKDFYFVEHPKTKDLRELHFNRSYVNDWNCIMEIVEAIQKIRPLIISHNHCEIHMYEEGKNISINIATNSTITAVIQAINQFLIYYNNENSNNRQP